MDLKEVTLWMMNASGFNKSEQTPEPQEINHTKCLTFNEGLDNLISKSKQIIIMMPVKASGTTMSKFIMKCMDGG